MVDGGKQRFIRVEECRFFWVLAGQIDENPFL